MHNMFPTLCAAYIEHRRGWLETLRNFVAERMNREVILWTPIKNNGMFPSGNKQQLVRILDQSVDLKETKIFMAD